MNTKLLHLGIASAITATMGLAHAQTSPSAPAGGAIVNSAEPTQFNTPPAPSVSSDGVPGISPESSGNAANANSPTWSNTRDSARSYRDNSVSDAPPADSLANVDERRNQGVQSNDGMNLPPAFSQGSSKLNSDKR